ncbi:MAG: type II 3-dehydroquinate dehydratase [Deltaproteobacteria bacterium]|nr:type II 3-dehydroquinate dehydratase [Deltaproteobacteria bacterium]
MKVMVINGPNLNMLGRREVGIYGGATLDDIESLVRRRAGQTGIDIEFFQSNKEGEIIDKIHSAVNNKVEGIVINPAGYTHTSVAIRDALLCVKIPFVEVHISNVAKRDSFRQKSLFSDIAIGTISGLGPVGYVLGLEALKELYGKATE